MFKAIGNNWFLLLLLLGAVCVRLIWIWAFPYAQITDFYWYFSAAKSISEGNGYAVNGVLTAWYPPGYPLVLGALFKVFGASEITGKAFNILLMLGIIVLSYRLSLLVLSEKASRLVAVLTAFMPDYIASVNLTASEPLSVFLSLCGCWFWLKRSADDKSLFLSGLFFGASVLSRPSGAVVPLALFTADIIINKQAVISCRKLGFVLVAMAIIITPWTMRNAIVFDEFVPISTNGGYNLAIGNNPVSTGAFIRNREAFQTVEEPYQTVCVEGLPKHIWVTPPTGLTETALDKACRNAALKYISERPLEALLATGKKLLVLYRRDDDNTYWNLRMLPKDAVKRKSFLSFWKKASNRAYALVLILFLGSTATLAINRLQWKHLDKKASLKITEPEQEAQRRIENNRIKTMLLSALMIVLFLTLFQMIFFSLPRYHAPMLPWMMILAVGFIAEIRYMLTRQRGKNK